jgi:hypothetical protein
MKTDQYYQSLPEGMTAKEVHSEFVELLSTMGTTNDPELVLNAISELSDRQWHTYSLLDPCICSQVTSLLKTYWSNSQPTLVEHLFTIAARLGLSEFISYVKNLDTKCFSTQVKQMVCECIDELEAEIRNPYSGMPEAK